MKRILRHRPSPAMVVACLALAISLGGTSYAAIKLPKNSVGAKQLKKNAVTGPKIKNNAITGADVNEASLAQVPAAVNATNATSAANAAKAANAANAANSALLQGKPASAFATVAQEAVHLVGAPGEPAFQNGWGNYGDPWSFAGYWKDSLGVVHLQGTPTGGAGFTTAFTLPVGYRPPQNLVMPVATAGTDKVLYIYADGRVQPGSGGDNGMDGLSFRAGGSSGSRAGGAGLSRELPARR
jgi:hypothetical protein